MPQAVADWWQATPGGTLFFAAAAIITAGFALWFAIAALRRTLALPRMVRTTGKVAILESNTTVNNTGGRRTYVAVKVTYRVKGRDYACRRLHLFRGNMQVGRPDPAPAAEPGSELLVYYDPKSPGASALLLDKPYYAGPVITAGLAAFFAWCAFDQFQFFTGG